MDGMNGRGGHGPSIERSGASGPSGASGRTGAGGPSRAGRAGRRAWSRDRATWLTVLLVVLTFVLTWALAAGAAEARPGHPLSEREQRAYLAVGAQLLEEGRPEAALGFYLRVYEATGNRHAQAMVALCHARSRTPEERQAGGPPDRR